MEFPMCQVCDKVTGEIICCSALGAVSFCYCKSCGMSGAEPYGILVGTIAMCGGIDHVADYVKDIIAPSLLVAGKSREEFLADVAKDMVDFDEYCNLEPSTEA